MKALNFDTLRLANIERVGQFTDAQGRICHSVDGKDWTPAEWLMAVTGELGELANVLKKVRRGDMTMSEARNQISDELADVQIYLDLLAHRLNVDLGRATIAKFNRKSHEKRLFVELEGDDWHQRIPSEFWAKRGWGYGGTPK